MTTVQNCRFTDKSYWGGSHEGGAPFGPAEQNTNANGPKNAHTSLEGQIVGAETSGLVEPLERVRSSVKQVVYLQAILTSHFRDGLHTPFFPKGWFGGGESCFDFLIFWTLNF